MRSFRVVACLVTGVALATFPTKPVMAEIQNGVCEPTEWCVFKDVNFKGCTFDTEYAGTQEGSEMTDEYHSCKGQQFKDSVSSYRNDTAGWLVMWEHPNFKGFRYCVAPRGSGNVLKSFNDKASSIAIADPEDFNRVGGEGKCNHVDRD